MLRLQFLVQDKNIFLRREEIYSEIVGYRQFPISQ